MKKKPHVSFCLATYKRPDFLRSTLHSILAQTYTNFEIIVSDNDPAGSGRDVVDKLHSKKIKYFKNKNNDGMVSNFNNALKHARGGFITFIADDDPVRPNMLETLIKLYITNPDSGSYYGACELYIPDPQLSKSLYLKGNITSLHDQSKAFGSISKYESSQFLKSFFTYRILPYFLWSTGITRRELVIKIGGMPNFGSPFLTDFAFICAIGALQGMTVINTPLGGQTIHADNHGRSSDDLKLLKQGVIGFHHFVLPHLKSARVLSLYEYFIRNWTISHLCNTFSFNHDDEKKQIHLLTSIFDDISNMLPFMRQGSLELYLRLHSYKPFNYLFIVGHFIERKFRAIIYA